MHICVGEHLVIEPTYWFVVRPALPETVFVKHPRGASGDDKDERSIDVVSKRLRTPAAKLQSAIVKSGDLSATSSHAPEEIRTNEFEVEHKLLDSKQYRPDSAVHVVIPQ